MQIRNPRYRERVQAVMEKAGFIGSLGLELVDSGPGWCETRLPVFARHHQQDGYVHAGVQASIADHTAGCTAFTLIGEGQMVLSIEFKINLLRPALGETLFCRGDVLRGGSRVVVAESCVYAADHAAADRLCAKATVTLAVMANRD